MAATWTGLAASKARHRRGSERRRDPPHPAELRPLHRLRHGRGLGDGEVADRASSLQESGTGRSSISWRCRDARPPLGKLVRSHAARAPPHPGDPEIANAILDGYLCPAEYMLYGQASYAEVIEPRPRPAGDSAAERRAPCRRVRVGVDRRGRAALGGSRAGHGRAQRGERARTATSDRPADKRTHSSASPRCASPKGTASRR